MVGGFAVAFWALMSGFCSMQILTCALCSWPSHGLSPRITATEQACHKLSESAHAIRAASGKLHAGPTACQHI